MRQVSGRTSRGFAFLLVLLYTLSAFDIPSFHRHEGEVLHTEENEQDACHLSIFHNVDKSCGHEKHLIAKESCAVCDMVTHRDMVLPFVPGKLVTHNPSEWVVAHYKNPILNHDILLPSRAPPIA